MSVKLKRAYDLPAETDGVRILVDRIWPRGVSKERIMIDDWLKQLAPSHELRKAFNHDPDKFSVFKEKYINEIKTDDEKRMQFKTLVKIIKEKEQDVTLVYAAKDTQHNQAVILKELLDKET